MTIKTFRVKGFRCLEDESLPCDQLTALVGANGSGKSSFMRALDLFYSPTPKIDTEDFYAGETSSGVVVSVTFQDLSEDAKNLFSPYIQGNQLTVERVFTCNEGRITAKYHGATLQHKGFDPVRAGLEVKDRGKTARSAYDALRGNAEYSSLPEWSALAAVPDALKGWEAANPDRCTRQRDDGQFFGFSEVAQGYLGKFTRMLFIPAVRDASDDAAEGRNTVLSGLMDLVVRSVLANREALKKLREETQKQFSEILDPTKLTELVGLSEQLTKTLRTFVPDSSVELKWLPLQDLDFPLPKADVKLVEDGYSSAVARTGHGLQRAFIMTMLQHLALAQTAAAATPPAVPDIPPKATEKKLPDLVLAIEEPELYQHPNRQRHFARILLQLASGKTPGVADRTQVLYSTHSPLFVGIDRMDQIRLLRKVSVSGKPKITKCVLTSGDEIAEKLWIANGSTGPKYVGETLMPRLQSIMTPWMSEGFFARAVALVEGEDDRAALLGMAKVMNCDLESEGISVIPCGGKVSMDRPSAIFQQLGIPTYVVWDGDKGENDSKPEDNHRLLRMLGRNPVDWPSEISSRFAVFERDLETTLREELGAAEFDRWLSECQKEFCIPKRKHALKNPRVIATIIQAGEAVGKTSASLRQICKLILALA
jgi:energy-coupling factor transporter ATP-binding protein EcfA2